MVCDSACRPHVGACAIHINVNTIYHIPFVRSQVTNVIFVDYHTQWKQVVPKSQGRTVTGGERLRTYVTFKNEFGTEFYVKCNMKGHWHFSDVELLL